MAETSVSLLQLRADASDPSAWPRLADIYGPLLQAQLLRYGLQRADAEDLVQEVLLTVARELPRFEHSGRAGAFRNWLRQILANRIRHFWRRRKSDPRAVGGSTWAVEVEELADDMSSATSLWNIEHDRYVMARLLAQVRPRFEPQTWEAFERQTIGGQRANIVAAELGMPLNSVYVARSRVLRTLRLEAAGLIEE